MHSTILSTFNKLLSVTKIFVLSIFEWPLKTGFTVVQTPMRCDKMQTSCGTLTGSAQLTKVPFIGPPGKQFKRSQITHYEQ